MSKFLSQLWHNEPARVVSTLIAIVQAVVTLLIAFNVSITADQRTSIIGLVTTIGALFILTGEIVRSQVSPTKGK